MLKLLALTALLAVAAAADYPEIEDFEQIDSTLTSVTLSWTLDVSASTPDYYTLIINDVLTNEFFYDGTDTYTANGLQSCTQYTFTLTADYPDTQGPVANAIGNTDDEEPGAVGDLTVEGSTISWTAPTNERCVDFYEVSWDSSETGESGDTQVVADTSFDLGTVSGCDHLTVTVYAVAGVLTGPEMAAELTTDYATPGIPRNLEVTPLSETTVELAWDPPFENPACVQDYTITYGPLDNYTEIEVSHEKEAREREEEEEEEEEDEEDDEVAEGPNGQSITAILDSLLPCTDYRFGVASLSQTGERSDETIVYLATNGTAPGELPDVNYDADEESITISWGDVSEEACLSVIQICYSDLEDQTNECLDVPSNPNYWTLSGLGACRDYEFWLSGMSEDGTSGPTSSITVTTDDVAPGAVQEMSLGNIGETYLTVSYSEPLDYPECANEYIVSYTNILDATTRDTGLRESDYTTDIDGLDACAVYDIGVNAVSVSGLEGPVTSEGTTLEQRTPEPPTSGSLVGSTDTSLTVLWYAPADTRFCVDAYEVRVSQGGSGPVNLDVPVLDFNREILQTISGLNACTTYVVEIRSKNAETNSFSDYAEILSEAATECSQREIDLN